MLLRSLFFVSFFVAIPEQLRRPNRSWAERQSGIDCDCFSIFVSSILTNLKIPHSFRIARYNKDTFQHVYVIVPIQAGRDYYIIDCVLNQFNYEKTFTEKKDFPMSLHGINVAVLSGADEDILDIISGLEGLDLLGETSEADRSKTMYEHLIRTRNLVAQKPYLIDKVDYPPAFLKMLDYAIQHWNTPNQVAALENLGRNEDELNKLNGMYGVPDDSEFDGADEDWTHLEGLSADETYEELNGKARKKASQEKRAAKKAAKKAKPKKAKKGFFRKVGQGIKKGVKKAVKAVVRFNPLSIAARNGYLLAMKMNFKKIASKLKWGYASQQQAAAKGVSAQQWQKSKNALAKVEKLFVGTLQGKQSALRNAILKGKAGGLSGFDGDEEMEFLGIVPAATIAAAAPVIAATLKILVDSGLMKKEEADQTESETNDKAAEADIPVTESQATPSDSAAEEKTETPQSTPDVPQAPAYTPTPAQQENDTPAVTPQESTSEESPSQESIPEPSPAEESPQETNLPAVNSEETPAESTPDEPMSEPIETTAEEMPATEDESQGGILGFVSSNPLLTIGGVALGIWGLSKLFGGKKSSGGTLSGTPKRKKKAKKKAPASFKTRKQKRGKGQKLKAITLR